eukprot:CAMPEP_0203944196 /NCGR_PEP_ID=MMETSP0359-20131031/79997_1 /ASSEMBLY_ACC=CAM_ASM_000338 /TAXON_ID=268821 /ORGANISM="Scrippsiella Hangoei, Strain SHTV-5" /LENGTH=35 /DNA_ID= /DNA_START= /DNA_END= /DNA_ORIENTATION=
MADVSVPPQSRLNCLQRPGVHSGILGSGFPDMHAP